MISEKEYKKLVLSIGCIISGRPAVPHHVKCFKNGAGKVSDFLIIPLAPEFHTGSNEAIHHDRSLFEMLHGREIDLLAKTIQAVVSVIKKR